MRDIEIDIFQDTDRKVALLNAIGHLTEADRRILYLYAETASMRETGKALGVSASTVYYIIKRIRQELKDKLNQYDY
jgi:RNA polymerase sigma factor (sigma-70 family)